MLWFPTYLFPFPHLSSPPPEMTGSKRDIRLWAHMVTARWNNYKKIKHIISIKKKRESKPVDDIVRKEGCAPWQSSQAACLVLWKSWVHSKDMMFSVHAKIAIMRAIFMDSPGDRLWSYEVHTLADIPNKQIAVLRRDTEQYGLTPGRMKSILFSFFFWDTYQHK